MATVTIATRTRKRGKSYIVHFVDPASGKKRYHASYRTKREADSARSKLKILLEGGTLPEESNATNTSRVMTFDEVAKLTIDEWDTKLTEQLISGATYKGYKHFLAPLQKALGTRLVASISEEEIRAYRKARLKEGATTALCNRQLFVLKQVFKQGVAEGCIKKDISKNIRYLNEKDHIRSQFMTRTQIQRLLVAADESPSRHYLVLAIRLAVEHGCSKQEILDLRWSDIDFDFEDTGRIRFFRTKNQTERQHRIMAGTREALLKRKAFLESRRVISSPDHHVVGHSNGKRMTDFKKAWKTLCSKCGISDFHFHDNRHTYCTNIILAGGSLKEAQAMIGHSDIRMTNRYANIESLASCPAQDKLSSWYAETGTDT